MSFFGIPLRNGLSLGLGSTVALGSAAGGGAPVPVYPEDVFSAYTYTGNGAAQTITNGLDLAGEGGLVWLKNRGVAATHMLSDTARGIGYMLQSQSSAAQSLQNYITSVNSDGFSLSIGDASNNASGNTYVSWTFRKAPKFFDVVTFTTPASGSAQISHGLGVDPGMIIIKATGVADSWIVYHRSTGINSYLILNDTGSSNTVAGMWNGITSTYFTAITGTNTIANRSYVAYLFAHDTDADTGIVQCGSFTTDASGNATVTLGWGPQYVMLKCSSTTGNWYTLDQSRGWGIGGDAILIPNSAAVESSGSDVGTPTATGFSAAGLTASQTYIYITVRRPSPRVYATLNPADKSAAITLSGGNLIATHSGATWDTARSTIALNAGKWYFEFVPTAAVIVNHGPGVATSTALLTNHYMGDASQTGTMMQSTFGWVNGAFTAVGAYLTGDTIGIAIDADNGFVYYYRNNVLVWSMTTAQNRPLYGGISLYESGAGTFNFGATALTYSPPSGYNAGIYT